MARILKRIKSILTDIKPVDNGHLIYLGINSSGNEICEIITPPNPIQKFTYFCGKEFIIETFRELFEIKPLGYVIFISGDECIIYAHSGFMWYKLKSLNGNLIKRHNKGGQSSVRFSRLAEESRHHYIVYCSDYIRKLIPCQLKTKSANNIYVFGSDELKNKLIEYPGLKDYMLNTASLYYTFTADTIKDKYFNDLFSKSDLDGNKRTIELVDIINTNPDKLLFNLDEIIENINIVEYICICQPKIYDLPIDSLNFANRVSNKDFYILDMGCREYGILKDYQIIAKLFYTIESNLN